MKLLARLAYLVRDRARRERELNEEILMHFKMAVEERVARGEARVHAERAVRREFGDPDRVREVTRAMWPRAWIDGIRQDVRFGIRSLRRDPAFTWSAAIVLTVGIGATATVFALADGLLFRDGPGISEPEELVGVRWIDSGAQGERERSWGYVDFEYLRDETSAFDGLLAYLADPIAVTTSAESVEPADAWVVSDNFFTVLGTDMAIGRGFLPEEGETPGTHPVVVISYAFWLGRFGADPAVLGRTIPINDTPFTIVGVTASDFRGISPIETPPDLYVPVMMQAAIIAGSDSWLERIEGERSGWLRLVARLRDDTTLAGAQANLEAVRTGWDDRYGAWWAALRLPDFRMAVTSEYKLNAEDAERMQRMLGFLAVVVAAILAIACANVAILQLARGGARRSEFAVRVALGAGRARLVAQLFTESLIVASIGGLSGFAFAYLIVGAIVPLLPYELSSSLAPDAAALVFSGVLTALATLVFGIFPSLHLSRAQPGVGLKSTGRVSGGQRFRNALVVAQIAVAVVLVTGAGLFVRSILAAESVDPGFEPDGRLVVVADLSVRGYDGERGLAFMGEALERARAIPGVVRATVAARPPYSGRSDIGVDVPGSETGRVILNFNWIGSGYFETLGIPIAAGRGIGEADDSRSLPVIVVNETTAARLWPGQRAVGKTLVAEGETRTVVGVAGDANYYALGEVPQSQVYVPMAQDFIPVLTFLVEAEVAPDTIAGPMRSVLRDLDPEIPISGVQTLPDLVDEQSASYRLLAVVGGAFGLVALILAIAGLYAVQSYAVTQRFREIGIRMALGAQSWQVSAGIVRVGTMITTIGLGFGLPIALVLGRTVEGMLFDVEGQDPVTFILVAFALVAVSTIASYVPARRAARVEPMVVLRDV